MLEDKILIEHLETSDESIFIDVTYNGLPFTGTAYESHARFRGEYNYVNGFGQGRCFTLFATGQLCDEFYLEKGVVIESSKWYEMGTMREYFRMNPYLHQYWDESGVLCKEEDETAIKRWYNTSKLKSLLIKKDELTYFSESGEWVVKIKTKDDYVVLDKKAMLFNEPYLSHYYMDLLQDNDFYKYFIQWFLDLKKATKSKIVCDMIKSNICWHKHYGMVLARQYCIKEAVPFIEIERNNHIHPPDMHSLDGTSSQKFCNTIAESAKLTLSSLSSSKGGWRDYVKRLLQRNGSKV